MVGATSVSIKVASGLTEQIIHYLVRGINESFTNTYTTHLRQTTRA